MDDDLIDMLRSMRSMLAMVSPSAEQDLVDMLDTVQKDVQKALCEKSSYSLGRLHEVLTQILEMGSGYGGMVSGLINMPPTFSAAVHSFIKAKVEATPCDVLLSTTNQLVSILSIYNQIYD